MKPSTTKFILGLVVLGIIVGIFALNNSKSSDIGDTSKTDSQKTENSQAIPTSSTPDLTSEWKTLENTSFTLKYPTEANAEARERESLISFMGQKQIDSGRTQTELSEGYSFRITQITPDPTLILEAVAQDERTNAVDQCQSPDGHVTQLTSVLVDSHKGFQYTSTGCSISNTETLVSVDETIYRISQLYVGDNEEEYKTITDTIFSTVSFTR